MRLTGARDEPVTSESVTKVAYRLGRCWDYRDRVWFEVERHWLRNYDESGQETCEHRHRSKRGAVACQEKWQRVDRKRGCVIVPLEEIRRG